MTFYVRLFTLLYCPFRFLIDFVKHVERQLHASVGRMGLISSCCNSVGGCLADCCNVFCQLFTVTCHSCCKCFGCCLCCDCTNDPESCYYQVCNPGNKNSSCCGTNNPDSCYSSCYRCCNRNDPRSPCYDCCIDMHGHETLREDDVKNRNTLFYSNQIRSEPDGDYIDNIHASWWHDYRKLELHHAYIQWLFPTDQPGVNSRAQTLDFEEMQWFRENHDAQRRLLLSYRMMLEFYGMVLADEHTGEITRADNWEERYDNLQRNPHNYHRITRIINSMSLLGFEHLVPPFVHFLATEIYYEHVLPHCRNSCEQYWIPALPTEAQKIITDYSRNAPGV